MHERKRAQLHVIYVMWPRPASLLLSPLPLASRPSLPSWLHHDSVQVDAGRFCNEAAFINDHKGSDKTAYVCVRATASVCVCRRCHLLCAGLVYGCGTRVSCALPCATLQSNSRE